MQILVIGAAGFIGFHEFVRVGLSDPEAMDQAVRSFQF